ncbi:hypothetical protein [Caballeronia sp. 15711]|uniref:hypothetical protein n=1 Tax=Caballeronia sp. 15711 TaxID=3391029 RepID=UPI0039E69D97
MEVVAACRGLGVSVAAIALIHKVNANLLRHWVDKAESAATTTGLDVVAMKQSAAAPKSPAFVPRQHSDGNDHRKEIRVEVPRSQQSITISWPTSDAAQCAAWLAAALIWSPPIRFQLGESIGSERYGWTSLTAYQPNAGPRPRFVEGDTAEMWHANG